MISDHLYSESLFCVFNDFMIELKSNKLLTVTHSIMRLTRHLLPCNTVTFPIKKIIKMITAQDLFKLTLCT